MSQVVSQVNDNEIEPMDAAKLRLAFDEYEKVFDDPPEKIQECTGDQISCMNHLNQSGSNPFVDFAVWKPLQQRLIKQAILRGTIIGVDGQMRPVEMKGPANIEAWNECFTVCRSAWIMLKMISLGKIENYRTLINYYAKMYGEQLWPLLYQTEVHNRAENWERTRRRGERELAKAKLNGTTHDFDPAKPWDWVIAQTTSSPDAIMFWKRELEDPAQ